MKYLIENQTIIQIDSEDLERIKPYRWRVDSNTGYIYSDFSGIKVYLHRFLLSIHQVHNGLVVDHKNRDIRDNRKENLRVCTQAENLRNLSIKSNNSTGYRNIYQKGAKFVLMSNYNGRVRYFGTYSSIIEALQAKIQLWWKLWNMDIRQQVNDALTAGVA